MQKALVTQHADNKVCTRAGTGEIPGEQEVGEDFGNYVSSRSAFVSPGAQPP